jgi:hypothetical protein
MTEEHRATGAMLDPDAILRILDRGARIHSAVRAAADLREQRAKAASPGHWTNKGRAAGEPVPHVVDFGPWPAKVTNGFAVCHSEDRAQMVADAEHITAEANPGHALAAVRLWRALAETWDHLPQAVQTATVAEVRAYLDPEWTG